MGGAIAAAIGMWTYERAQAQSPSTSTPPPTLTSSAQAKLPPGWTLDPPPVKSPDVAKVQRELDARNQNAELRQQRLEDSLELREMLNEHDHQEARRHAEAMHANESARADGPRATRY